LSITYDLNGNRTNYSGTPWSTGADNRLTYDGTFTYSYDEEGNLTSRVGIGDVTTYTWDYRNRLTEAVETTTVVKDDQFTYDVFDRRVGKTVNGVQQFGTVYDGDNPYADYAGGTWTRYLYGDAVDQLFARYAAGAVSWYLTDNLGSVRKIVDASGASLYTVNYDSFGNKVGDGGSGGDRFRFTGREWDGEIGQYFYRARYYDSGSGRFLSEDPLGYAAGDNNLYRYLMNAPAGGTDAYGLQPPGPEPPSRTMFRPPPILDPELGKKIVDSVLPEIQSWMPPIEDVWYFCLSAMARKKGFNMPPLPPKKPKNLPPPQKIPRPAPASPSPSRPPNMSPPGAARQGAFNAAKKANGIPLRGSLQIDLRRIIGA
jgi:RHS repeat-associated protein